MPTITRSLAVALTAAVAGAGCGTEPTASREASPRTSKRDEERQAVRRDIRLIKSHCLRRPRPPLAGERGGDPRPTTAQEAGAAVKSMLVRLGRRKDADFYEQYEWREFVAAMAGFLEERRCLAPWVPRVDRALRRLPLAEPPPEYQEDYAPEPEYEDYGYP